MPGVNLNLSLPSLADNLATIVSKTATALSAIQTDLAAKVTPSAININSSLSMNGAALTNTGSVQFVSGNVPTTAGALWYYNGEFYCRDATGQIQITSLGNLNASSFGGITGLGGTTAAVTYDLASQEFRFTADAGVWADLAADDLILYGTAGSVRFAVDAAITSARQFIIKDLPTSGVSGLVYNAATSTVESAENQRITNAFKVTTLDVSGNAVVSGALTVSGAIKHPDYGYFVPITAGYATTSSGTAPSMSAGVGGAGGLNFAPLTGGLGIWKGLIQPIRDNETVKEVRVYLSKTGTSTCTIQLRRYNPYTGVDALVSGTNVSATTTTVGAQTITLTPGTPPSSNGSNSLLAEQFYVYVEHGTGGTATGDQLSLSCVKVVIGAP